MNVRHAMGVLHLFSINNIFYDKMDLRLFYFHVTIYGSHCHMAVSDWSPSGLHTEVTSKITAI